MGKIYKKLKKTTEAVYYLSNAMDLDSRNVSKIKATLDTITSTNANQEELQEDDDFDLTL